MNLVRTIDRIFQGKANRREIARTASAAGVVGVAMPVLSHPVMAQTGSDLMYFTWGGFEAPELFPAFAETWGEPSTSFYGDEYEAIEKLRAGFEADVVCPCIDVMPSWMRVGLQPLDESRLIYLDDSFESIRNPAAAFHEGERYYTPTYYGFSSFVYRTDLTEITPETESWSLFFDEAYKGRMAIWDSTDAVVPVAALVAGITENPYTPDGEDLEKVEALMRKQRDLVRFYWNEQTMPIRLSPTTTTFRVLPIARVKLGVSGSGDIASNSEQGPEGVERVERQSRARVSRYERNTTAHDRKNHASATALQLRRGPRQPATLPVKLSM